MMDRIVPPSAPFQDHLEGYSWGVCEYESEDGGDGFREGFGLPGVFRTLLVFLLQAAFVKFRSSRSTSLGARYPRAE